jgi:gas vesicle protein
MVFVTVMVIGAVGLFKPLVNIKMPNRLAAVGWIVAGFIGFVAVMINAPPKPSEMPKVARNSSNKVNSLEPPKPDWNKMATDTVDVMEGLGGLCEKSYATMMANGQSKVDKYKNARTVIVQCDQASKQIRKAVEFRDVDQRPQEIDISHCLTVYASARDAGKLVQQKAEYGALLTSDEIELRDNAEFVRDSMPLCIISKENLKNWR